MNAYQNAFFSQGGLDFSQGLFDFFGSEATGVLYGAWDFLNAVAAPAQPSAQPSYSAPAKAYKSKSSHHAHQV